MSLNIESTNHHISNLPLKSLVAEQWLLLINGVVFAIGAVSGPLLIRLYFLHGGNRKWISAWLQTSGSALLGIGQDKDRPVGVTDAQYLLGFLLTLGAAALLVPILQRFRLHTLLHTWDDHKQRLFEAREFALGESKYYLVLAFTAVVWQMSAIGFVGLIFCSSSVTTGVFGATLVPMTEAAAVIVYHEKFSGEKGVSLAMCVWRFASYLYGSYRESRKQSIGVQNEFQIDEHQLPCYLV
ncbi:hypothetical protein Sjap_012520 [Stephania japonica]|uniref:Uncharacterized protein n=1 Tax=Stephania japonica TaxID=461633 RepID=A0AAP0NXP9_9MAGN